MSNVPTQFGGTRRLATLAVGAAVLAALLTLGAGAYLWMSGGGAALGLAMVSAGLVVLVLGVLLYAQVVLIHKFVANSFRMYDGMLEVADLLRRQGELTRQIAENSALSDWAKRTSYREKEYECLRVSIQSAIVRQDWEAAEHLIRDLGDGFGYRDEAASLRDKLLAARRSTQEERIEAALKRFEGLCDQHKWDQALRECERLRTIFQSDMRIAGLAREIDLRRNEHKRRLLREYDEAVRGELVDRAHALLLELDHYLTRREADELKESARRVFRARLEQLRAQFSIAVTNRQFHVALEVGERVCREFPNSGYAREIDGMMPVLRQRAGQPGAAAEGDVAVAAS
jgi:hypothetical protein